MFRLQSRPAAAALLCLLSAGGAILLAQQGVIRVDVNLVHLIATVKNKSGQLVGALGKDDFELYDNGVLQEVKVFERQTEQPLSVALLIDVSGSTAKDLKFEIDSASRFLRALLAEGNPEDRVALFKFDYEIVRVSPFTHDFNQLDTRLKRISGSAGTALYDAIYLSASELEARQGRKVMVIISDGGNTTSHYDTHQALEAAQLADAVIYPVVVMPITNNAGRNIGGENALTFMAERTGGRTFLPSLGKQLDKAFDDIITELRTEYYLGFYPHDVPLTKDHFHTLKLQVKDHELQVSSRNGYYGEAEDHSAKPGDSPVAGVPGQLRKKR
ncbi:MAG TPA: VWA domain-containing protein [Candidatus Sulfopaludibacter sp.]|jgi:Ca-activated chloride channel family protein|nr:VWA domain-containing protein [Candidatus Sulfopaludibacter sp.]